MSYKFETFSEKTREEIFKKMLSRYYIFQGNSLTAKHGIWYYEVDEEKEKLIVINESFQNKHQLIDEVLRRIEDYNYNNLKYMLPLLIFYEGKSYRLKEKIEEEVKNAAEDFLNIKINAKRDKERLLKI